MGTQWGAGGQAPELMSRVRPRPLQASLFSERWRKDAGLVPPPPGGYRRTGENFLQSFRNGRNAGRHPLALVSKENAVTRPVLHPHLPGRSDPRPVRRGPTKHPGTWALCPSASQGFGCAMNED